jgi:hypothetical protein
VVRIAYRNLVQNPEWKRVLEGRTWRIMDQKKLRCDDVGWKYLAQDRRAIIH